MAKEISGLAKESTDCYALWIRGRSIGEIAAVMGLSVQQVELRISRARMSKAELSAADELTDVRAVLDDTVRQAQELLKFPEDLTGHELHLLKFVRETALMKADRFGLMPARSDD